MAQSPSKSSRPAKNLRMLATTGSVDLAPDSITRFNEASATGPSATQGWPAKSREAEGSNSWRPVTFSSAKKDSEGKESSVGKVHLPGYGTADGASTLAKVLLSRINISIYGPEARRQQQQQYQQMQMMSNGMPQMQVHGVHVPVQGGQGMPMMHGMSLPTQG
ncbi:unnamed protein product [Effrenium voratum]|uniref:Uncharacterized protein n=1 Tax=Effrenium voratum TaxID=2562239 RepID=A0AA36IQK5_9DINO|nr:unnamed protein product [Effrenium voratum]CAJ1392054.1 unnamed protein product [Effrenium voratum]CAJ1425107.1 unnamed protein product [Effrenium voratum]